MIFLKHDLIDSTDSFIYITGLEYYFGYVLHLMKFDCKQHDTK